MAANKPPPKKSPGGAANDPSNPSATGSPASGGAAPGSNAPVSHLPKKVTPIVGGKLVTNPNAEKVPLRRPKAPPVDEKIEEKVYTLPGFKEHPDVPLFSDFLQKVAPMLRLSNMSREILVGFANIDVKAERIAQSLRANNYYESQFIRQIESLGQRSETPSLEGGVVLLGMQNSRNLIVSLQATRAVFGGHPEWTKEGKLKFAPNEVLKYALKTEEALQGNKSSYADTAYVAGVLFDYLNLIAGHVPDDKKRAQAFVETVYNHGLKSAQIAVEIVRDVPDFSFQKYLFSACLIHDIGKIILAILDPKYLDFMDEMAKKDLPRAVRQYVEQKKFKVDHAMLGSAACHYFQVFKVIEKAILYHHEPYFLEAANYSLYQLAAIVSLSSNMANNFRKIEKNDDPVVGLWKGPEIKGFEISTKALKDAVAKLSTSN